MAKNTNKPKAQVFHFNLFGNRNEKYNFLENNSISSVDWKELDIKEPEFLFVELNFEIQDEYSKGFKIDELFPINSTGIKTHRDHFVMDFDKKELSERIEKFYDKSFDDRSIANQLNLKDNRDWSVSEARLKSSFNKNKITLISYRPFDFRFCYYDNNLIDFDRENVMKHYLKDDNMGFTSLRQSRNKEQGTFWINKLIIGKDAISILDTCTTFPLYLYPEKKSEDIFSTQKRTPNLNMEIVNQIAKNLGLTFIPEKEPVGKVCYINNPEVRNDFKTTFTPIDLLDYIYAILHSPAYREKYREFLKVDFPRVPYPADSDTFWQLVEPGGQLRQIHLLESPKVNEFVTSYPVDGDNSVTRKMTTKSMGWEPTNDEKTTGRVWINNTQYFDGVPLVVWEFYMGGYQPAQKWLKDRHGRTLSFEDILHYQKIIAALTETHRLMKKIDEIKME